MRHKRIWIGGSVLVIGGLGLWAFRSGARPLASSAPPPHHAVVGRLDKHKTPKGRPLVVNAHGNPIIGVQSHGKSSAKAPGLTLAQSFQAITHRALPHRVQALSVPWQPKTRWVFVPQAIQGQLWFGQKTGTGPWHWTSEDLPGMLSRQLPPPVYDTLQWAADLHANAPGPHLPGSVQWNVITGRVGEPVGWTTQILPADQSPVGEKALALTIWLPSETGVFKGYYGIETLWDGHNAKTGHGALLMLTAASHVPGKGGTS